MALFNFNAESVEPSQNNFDPIPAGNYLAQIITSDINTTRSGSGQILNLQFQVLEGEYKGRIIFCNLNIQNTNETAERIAQENLSAICRAIGVKQLQDTIQLHNKPMMIKVKIRKDDQYGDRNEAYRFDAIPGKQHTMAPPNTMTPPPPASNPATATKPWNR